MAKSELSPEDVSDVVLVLSSRIKSPPRSVSGDLIQELSSETTSDTSSGLSSDFAIPDCIYDNNCSSISALVNTPKLGDPERCHNQLICFSCSALYMLYHIKLYCALKFLGYITNHRLHCYTLYYTKPVYTALM